MPPTTITAPRAQMAYIVDVEVCLTRECQVAPHAVADRIARLFREQQTSWIAGYLQLKDSELEAVVAHARICELRECRACSNPLVKFGLCSPTSCHSPFHSRRERARVPLQLMARHRCLRCWPNRSSTFTRCANLELSLPNDAATALTG